MESFDVLIIGGGVIGLSIMRELLHFKLKIGLLERHDDVCNEVSKANSGIIHAGFDDRHGSVKSTFSPSGSRRFEQLDAELNFGYRKIGSLVLARTQQEARALEDLRTNGTKNGVAGLSLLDTQALYESEAGLCDGFVAALLARESGVVSPYEFGIALAENCVKNNGALLLGQRVHSIESYGTQFVVYTDTFSYKTRLLINAAGLYSDHISSLLGIESPPIEARKGSYIVFNRGTGSSVKHVLFSMPGPKGKGILVTPTYHGNLLIGPNAVEGVQKDDVSTTQAEISTLLQHAQKTIQNIPLRLAINTFAGVRPRIQTNDFRIGEAGDRFFECSGIASPGLTAAPAIAAYVKDSFVKKHLQLEKNSSFQAHRAAYTAPQFKKDFLPAKEATKEAKRSISDPECMICRCEQVRRKTIDAALGAGIPIKNTDSIKRRTRAGQGFCQGDFCRTRVAEIIAASENDASINPEHITQEDAFEPRKKRVSLHGIRRSKLS